ncbi:MAG: hypothetical protein KC619_33715 [Myxococcales bacterium]|nr:hypothetical protein [Myxococcales bacterium]
MTAMKWFVRCAGAYNASAVIAFLTPGVLPALGVPLPHSPFWVWLPALLGLFAGLTLLLASTDLRRYGTLPYWNGIVRLVFVVAALTLSFGESAGTFMGLLAWGDLPLALGAIFGMPLALGCSHLDLLLARDLPVPGGATSGESPR